MFYYLFGKVLMDMIRIKTPLKIGYVPLLNINQLITEKKYLAKYEQTEINNEIYYIDKNLVKLEINEDVEDILRCLNNKDKELFIKYYIEGYELEEIAKTNKTNVTNLYSRLSRVERK